MKKPKQTAIDKVIRKIEDAEESLCNADNNWQYIRSLNRLKTYLEKFDSLLTPDERVNGEYAAQYAAYFCSGGWFSFYSRVLNSIQDYEYGNKPFKAYQKTIRELKVGEMFKLKDTDTSPVWQRGEYVREENLKKFCCTKYNDINHSKNFDGKQVVYVDFTF